MTALSQAQQAVDHLTHMAQKSVKSALQSRQPMVSHNIQYGVDHKSWQPNALKFGYNAIIVLPLVLESRSLGVLTIYAAEPEAFTDQEMGSLNLLSEHIAQKLGSG